MGISEARAHIGSRLSVRYLDRNGGINREKGVLLDVEYVPMYGSTLVFDFGEVALDRVVQLAAIDDQAA
jgi:hypothetical protein